MTYKITEECLVCGTCLNECPSGAIHEGEPFFIDVDACAECGVCKDSCPTGAIIEE